MSTKCTYLNDELHRYLVEHSLRESPLLERLREETASLEMAVMQISPEQGQWMNLLTRLHGAKHVLEIGVFTGYSSICIASALPEEGELIACDVSEEWTSIAKRYWQEAGLSQKICLKLQPASWTLTRLIENGQQGKFDMAFIDADKTSYDTYYESCLRLLRVGGLMLIDNVLWGGSVIDMSDQSEDTKAIRQLNDKLHQDHRITLSMLPIGDGLTIAIKTS
jgi:O-methyltransferase